MRSPTRPWLAAAIAVLGFVLVCPSGPAFPGEGRGARSGASKSGSGRAHHQHRHHHHRHRHGSVAFLFAAAPIWPWWSYPLYEPAPTAGHYIERGEEPGAEWFYCASASGYYPAVPECAGGWQRLPAVPPQ
jgi:hypothetical protein